MLNFFAKFKKTTKRFFVSECSKRFGFAFSHHIELAAYKGLCEQAYSSSNFSPYVASSVWGNGQFWSSDNCPSSPRREIADTSHYYGHDIVLKRYAGLPLVGPYIRYTFEHGLKVNPAASFEPLASGTHSFLCMGSFRARSISSSLKTNARAIGPWIHYAEPVISIKQIENLKNRLGKTLLVILAHDWPGAKRSFDRSVSIKSIEMIKKSGGYRTVLLSSHFLDKDYSWPQDWLVVSHGHKYNPWFLDCLKTIFLLSDGLATNYFSTHVGYAFCEGLELHWIGQSLSQDITGIDSRYFVTESDEWNMRSALASNLSHILQSSEKLEVKAKSIYELLDPYWGFSSIRTPFELKSILSVR